MISETIKQIRNQQTLTNLESFKEVYLEESKGLVTMIRRH